MIADLVLPASSPEAGIGGTEQHFHANRSIENGNVSEQLSNLHQSGVEALITSAAGEHNKWKIRPRGLPLDMLPPQFNGLIVQRLVSDDDSGHVIARVADRFSRSLP